MRASDLPLSVLIVGVGGADFKQMEVYLVFPVRLRKAIKKLLLKACISTFFHFENVTLKGDLIYLIDT